MLQNDLKTLTRKSSLPAGILLALLMFTSVTLRAQTAPTGTSFVSENQYVYGEVNLQPSSPERLSGIPASDSSFVRSRTILAAQLEPSNFWTIWMKITSILLIFLIVFIATIGSWVRAFKLP